MLAGHGIDLYTRRQDNRVMQTQKYDSSKRVVAIGSSASYSCDQQHYRNCNPEPALALNDEGPLGQLKTALSSAGRCCAMQGRCGYRLLCQLQKEGHSQMHTMEAEMR